MKQTTRKQGKGASTASGRGGTTSRGRSSAAQRTGSRRKAVVFTSLLGVLTATSVLLKAMAPTPMRPDAADTLFAYGTNDSLDAIFQMQAPVEPQRWQYLYIHQSKTRGGNALTLGRGPDGVGDHFVIGNGDGLADGELQISQRWNHQLAAVAPTANVNVDDACISICVVGDFDQKPPTPMQLGRLGQLVQALQLRCRIPASRVQWVNENGPVSATTTAGIGRYFPVTAFHEQLRTWAVANP